jgi:hypothetical protein
MEWEMESLDQLRSRLSSGRLIVFKNCEATLSHLRAYRPYRGHPKPPRPYSWEDDLPAYLRSLPPEQARSLMISLIAPDDE